MTSEAALRRLDPAIAPILEQIGHWLHADLEPLPLAEAMALARPDLPTLPPPDGTRDLTFGGPDGASLMLRLYGVQDGGPARPALLYLHGGGFVAGTVAMDDRRCARLAQESGHIIASLEYRLAPENPFPNAIEDACAAWAYLQSAATDLGIDPALSGVSGSSAGGHLATGLCLLASERGLPMPHYLILTNPALDPELTSASYHEFEGGPFLTKARMAWYWKQYAAGRAPSAAATWNPLRADVSTFPPSLVITAELDVLRDEGEAFAERLVDAGIPATTQRHAGMIHGFISVVADHAETQSAIETMATFMNAQTSASQ